jgi:hypothetical protein
MTILKNLFSRALLAVVLATGAGAAAAGPLYHVDLDLTSFSGLGYLDMQFVSSGEFSPATATLTGFSKYFNEDADKTPFNVEGSVQEGKLTFSNNDWADLFQSVTLGQHLGFDIGFSGPESGLAGAAFTIGLWDETGFNPLVDVPLLQFFVHPGDVRIEAGEYASVGPAAAVPEPSAALLVPIGLIGLMLAAATRRRA